MATPEKMDDLLYKIESKAVQIMQPDLKKIKKKNLEVGILEILADMRDSLESLLKDKDRSKLTSLFSEKEGMERLARMKQLLEHEALEEVKNTDDARYTGVVRSLAAAEVVALASDAAKAMFEEAKAAEAARLESLMRQKSEPEPVAAEPAPAAEPAAAPAEPEPAAAEPVPMAVDEEKKKEESEDEEVKKPPPKMRSRTGTTTSAFGGGLGDSVAFKKRLNSCANLEDLQAEFAVELEAGTLSREGSQTAWTMYQVARVDFEDKDLTVLDLSHVPLPDPDKEPMIIPRLFKALAKNENVTEINMAFCGLKDSYGEELVPNILLNPNTKVVKINLESNLFCPPAVFAMQEALKVNATVEEFRITNQMGASKLGGPVEIKWAETMRENKTLCKLGYTFNDPTSRNVVDKMIMNNSGARRKRLAAAKAAA